MKLHEIIEPHRMPVIGHVIEKLLASGNEIFTDLRAQDDNDANHNGFYLMKKHGQTRRRSHGMPVAEVWCPTDPGAAIPDSFQLMTANGGTIGWCALDDADDLLSLKQDPEFKNRWWVVNTP